MKKLILTLQVCLLAALIHATANASQECDWSIQVAKDESYRIDHRNSAIGNLNSTIVTDKDTLNRELIPLLEAWSHANKIYDFKSQTTKESQVAVKQAIIFVQETIISNRAMAGLVERLKRQSQLSPDLGLADQIRSFIQHHKLDPSATETLNQLANAVALVESETADWQASEKDILESYLEGKTALVDGLLNKLSQLNERLTSDLNDLDASHSADQARADEAAKNVSDMQNKISSELTQIDGLQKANVDSQAHMARWNVNTYCPKIDPRPIDPRFL
jgi:hypothetical protein